MKAEYDLTIGVLPEGAKKASTRRYRVPTLDRARVVVGVVRGMCIAQGLPPPAHIIRRCDTREDITDKVHL